ncbi:MAG: 3-phosphoserine/phosphohydroxythreonine transaminase [Spirochaetia bacterium]|nr:3-phosphoserine/phosphohydroxythreonine transaminase [Spirochaetia bacterium]
MNPIYNFNPGPSVLPQSVLKKVQAELVNYPGLGYSILEDSHRSKTFLKILADTKDKLKSLLGLGDKYEVLFMQGGASTQFFQIPMNFLQGKKADYIDTGSWVSKAVKEAKLYGEPRVIASSKDRNYNYIPKNKDLKFNEDSAYIYLCSNNTIEGTQWKSFPSHPFIPLVGDFSSDILSRRVDISPFALVYAGAQKNLGPAGVTIVIVRKDFLPLAAEKIPTMCSYKVMVENDSLYNTPPVFPIYLTNYVLDWIIEQGGVDAVEKVNNQKAGAIYSAVDASNGFYTCPVSKEDRSFMNIVYTLPSEEKTEKFLAEAKALGFLNLKGHRSVGGIRASVYNAFPLEGAQKLGAFMTAFARKS